MFLNQRDNVVTAAAGVGSIAFMNFSLQANSIGFYQITKLCVIPVVLVIEFMTQARTQSKKILFSLGILLLGVGIATVTDVEFNLKGMLWACIAVVCTAQFQIWQGTMQKQHGLGAIQATHSTAIPMSLITLVGVVAVENDITTHQFSPDHMDVFLILLTCIIALTMNVTSYGLIGKTSAVTFQVVGHAKTCLILASGFIFFTSTITVQVVKNMAGLAIAVVGMILYGHLKSADSARKNGEEVEDFCDKVMKCFGVEAPKAQEASEEVEVPQTADSKA